MLTHGSFIYPPEAVMRDESHVEPLTVRESTLTPVGVVVVVVDIVVDVVVVAEDLLPPPPPPQPGTTNRTRTRRSSILPDFIDVHS
jgi:hypothetical protein